MTLRLNGDSSGFTEIKAADAAGDNSIKLPASNGSANQLLQNGGTAGELQYTNAGGGLHYDSSGRLLAGTSTSLRSAGIIQIAGSSYPAVDINSFGTTSNPELVLRTARGTAASPTIVSSGDNIGKIYFQAYDGATQQVASSIESFIDGTPGADVMPGKLTFSTNAGSTVATPRVEIGSNGALKLLAGCPGIDFSGIQTNAAGMTSETLDSYEEGTWTPAILGTSSDPTITYTDRDGRYTKIGNQVTIWCYLKINTVSGGSGLVNIGGLPFNNASAPQASEGATFVINYYFNFNALSAGQIPTGYVRDNDNKIYFIIAGNAGGVTTLAVTSLNNSLVFYGSATYFANT